MKPPRAWLSGLYKPGRRYVAAVPYVLVLIPAVWHIASVCWIFASRINYPMDIEWLRAAPSFTLIDSCTASPCTGHHPRGFFRIHIRRCISSSSQQSGYLLGWTTGLGVLFRSCSLPLPAWLCFGRSGFRLVTGGKASCSRPSLWRWPPAASRSWVRGTDLVRNDSVAIALPIMGAAVLSDTMTRRRMIVGALLFTAAVFTKQTGILFIAWMCLFLLIRDFRQGLRFAVLTGAMCAITLGILLLATHGFFWLYVFEEMSTHVMRVRRAVVGVKQLVAFAPFLPILPMIAILAARKGWLRARTVLWCGMLLSALPAALLPFAKAGGFSNNLIPVAFCRAQFSYC